MPPLLFNIHASDQPTTSNNSVDDYSDDKVIFQFIMTQLIIASTNLQSHWNLQSEWYEELRIKVNHGKSVHTTNVQMFQLIAYLSHNSML